MGDGPLGRRGLPAQLTASTTGAALAPTLPRPTGASSATARTQ